MSSLQEQLLKAGLVDENKLKQATREKHKTGRQQRKNKGKSSRNKAPAAQTEAQIRQQKRIERDRELNEKRGRALEQKAIAAQVKQLIENNKIDRSKGEIPYSFVYRSKVKKMYIGETEKNLLAAGKLAIVTLVINHEGRRFELVPTDVAQKIAERDAEAVIELGAGDDSAGDEDDPYADYKIPDDLTW
jgi:uncharacterized protein YaiL (DUF2058 family)